MKKIRLLLFVFTVVLFNCYIFFVAELPYNPNVGIEMVVFSDKKDTYQLFYGETDEFNEEDSFIQEYLGGNFQKLMYNIDGNTKFIRIDLGTKSAMIDIKEISIVFNNKKLEVTKENILNSKNNMIEIEIDHENLCKIRSMGNDPYIIIDLESLGLNKFVLQNIALQSIIRKSILCIFADLVLGILFLFSKGVLSLPVELFKNRELILQLSVNDFKTKYAGSYLGIIWAFIQPIVTILIYWFVFQVGFKNGAIDGIPFVLWLIAGLVPWFFFSDSLNGATNSMIEYNFLVKKVVFNISVLPIVKIFSAFYVHVFFIVLMFLCYFLSGNQPNIYCLQIIYFAFCTFAFSLAISYASCAIIIFFRDLGQIINIVLQVGIWLTPIMWHYSMFPAKLQFLLKLNPMYYIIEGYRDSMMGRNWFWEHFNMTFYFWMITILMFCLGTTIFRKLKIHFADVI